MNTCVACTLVLIPGLMCDASLFAGVLPGLSRKRAIHLADLTQDDTVERMARRIAAATRGPLDVLGFSMGGMVAMALARLAPRRVARLALLDTNDAADSDAVRLWRSELVARSNAGELGAVMSEAVVPRYFDSVRPPPSDLTARCLQMALELGPTVFERQFSALARRRNQHDTLCAFKGSALVLRGRNDVLCTEASHLHMVQAMPHALYVEVDGAAHLSILEQPEQVGAALQTWLEH